MANDDVAKTRRIRNLKKFQVIMPKRVMILLVNLITYSNEEIKEPESLIKAQSLPQWELWKEVI